AGVLSAAGILTSPRQRTLVRSWARPADRDGLEAALAALAAEATRRVGPDAEVTTALDCRYAGQSHELTVPDLAAFHAEHERRNAFARPDAPVAVVALRATATLPAAVDLLALPAPERATGVGPVALAEPDCTIWVPVGWQATVGAAGA